MTSSRDLVVGIDSSTQSTKAIAWTREGFAEAEGRAPLALSNPKLYHFEQDPESWWTACVTALKELFTQVSPDRVAAIAISNQRETVAFLDAERKSMRPAITWLDERARQEVEDLSAELGADTIHRITGRFPDITPCVYCYLWMKRHEPEIFSRTACFADVQSFLVHRLSGQLKTGWISADPMGLFDLQKKQWSPEILNALDLSEEQMPAVYPPGTHLGDVSDRAAAETGLLADTAIFAAGGDGQLAGLGTNCTAPGRAYINLGTAVVSGVWSQNYAYDKAWRTEIAAQGEGYILENCLRSGTFLINWFVDQFTAGDRENPEIFRQLEEAASAIPRGCDGLMALPYWSGVMDPHWDTAARGCLIGFGGGHSTAHVYRALIEGMTLDQAMRGELLERNAGLEIKEYLAIGGGAASPLWRQMLADATGKPVLVSDTVEASALGAGMIAAFGAGWYASIVEAAEAMTGTTEVVEPNSNSRKDYQELLEIYRGLYDATAEINRKLVAFASRGAEV
ncbi:xylulose kinase [Pelagibius litoralis]|uniref:Xylulose kinase n=1 Tax=Pelagibius litoralis TaxID=374515 RepID=A0A967C7D7_9PROT|nr:FGGY-family carbohydrate kinase [Pelagibius litoralis]NIA67717.1 xylulose kinase [Pelagibius litoralis]